MPARSMCIAIGYLLLLAALGPSEAQSPSGPGPSLEEAQAVWTGFWTSVVLGDMKEARRYVHSHRQHLFPGDRVTDELRAMGQQMTHCRLDSSPLALDANEVVFRVLCAHRGETAKSQVGLRRDLDGTWRLSGL